MNKSRRDLVSPGVSTCGRCRGGQKQTPFSVDRKMQGTSPPVEVGGSIPHSWEFLRKRRTLHSRDGRRSGQ